MPFVIGDKFIDDLINAGVVPGNATHVIIDAKYGEVVKIHYSTIDTDEDKLAAIASSVIEAFVQRPDDPGREYMD